MKESLKNINAKCQLCKCECKQDKDVVVMRCPLFEARRPNEGMIQDHNRL